MIFCSNILCKGDKAAALGAELKVLLFCAKFDKGGGPVITQFSKLKDAHPTAQFIAVIDLEMLLFCVVF